MKRMINYCIICLLFMALTACKGDVNNVKIIEADSNMYTQKDIHEGIDVVKDYFKKHFEGCKLIEIKYASDQKSLDYKEWASRHEADEVMVFISDFYVGREGADGSLNPNSTYEDWMWILVREKNGNWRHADHGYG